MDLQTAIKESRDLLSYLESLAHLDGHPNTLLPPYCISGGMSIFGLEWDGKTDDCGDEDSHGVPLKGAWGADTHNPTIVGCAIPIRVLRATLGGTTVDKIKGYTVEIMSQVTQVSVKAIDICDLGPSGRVKRPIDGTWNLHKQLGHIDYGIAKYGEFAKFPATFPVTFWIEDPKGIAVEIKGWDFKNGAVS